MGKDLDLLTVGQKEKSMGRYFKAKDFGPNKEIF